jgi:hypothetical protein
MRTFRDAKAMAKSLRETLGKRDIEISHSESLEIVAAQFALKDWNTLAAKIDASGARAEGGQTTPGGPQFRDAIPILRIFSVEKAKEFYVDFLGFTIDWEHRFDDNAPLYAQVSRAGLKLHLASITAMRVPDRRCSSGCGELPTTTAS